MNLNMKKKIGAGALALALVVSCGAAALASDVREDIGIDVIQTAVVDDMSAYMTEDVITPAEDAEPAAEYKTDPESSQVFVSTDGGKTWEPAADVAVDDMSAYMTEDVIETVTGDVE